jgi:hypothetical protein
VPAALPTAERVQHAVATVYQRPEYAERHGFGDWLRETFGQAADWFAELIGGLLRMRETNPLVFWVIVAWLGGTAIAIVAHLVWTAMQAARMGDDAPERAPRLAKPRTAADWEADALRLAAEGRLREAAAALYQALLLRLDAREVVRYDPSKTPGDYRGEARRHPEAARALGAFLRLFEPVAFGGRALDADGWERLRAAAEGAGHG